jgi:death-on-curing protein
VGLVRNHGFVDGNKRTGLAGSLVFLGLNDLALHAAPAELHALVMRVATTQLDDDAVAGYLRHRITARG